MTKAGTKRAAIYARVSRDKHEGLQREGRSITEQEAECRTACAEHGWDVFDVYDKDKSISASRYTTAKRDDWERLSRDLRAGRFDVLVLWEPSRASRRLTTWSDMLDTCRALGVLVHVVSHRNTYDLSKPRDWRSLAEDGIDSAYESDKLSERIKRSMVANARNGDAHGRSPYGYKRVHDVDTGRVSRVIDPVKAPVVRDIFKRVAAGEPVSRITNWLNEQGVPADRGDNWTRAVVRRIALNHAYIGVREHRGELHPGAWEPIVTQEQFYAARNVLMDPARKTTRPGAAKHLLSYVARCGVCDAPLSASPARGYFCSAAGHVTASIELVDQVVETDLLAKLEREPLLDRLSARDESAIAGAREEVARLRGRLTEFRDGAAAGTVSLASFSHIEAQLVPQIEAAERRAVEAGLPVGMRGLMGQGSLQAKWDALPIAAKREVVRTVMDVYVDHSMSRGRHSVDDFDRVRTVAKRLS